jgi:ribosome-associated translation inhibitor RaiA
VPRDIFIIDTSVPRQLRVYTRGRLDRALAPFADRLDSVKVSVAGAKRGEAGITCEIKVRLIPAGIWIIQESWGPNAYLAVENAADALARSLGRQLARLNAAPAA